LTAEQFASKVRKGLKRLEKAYEQCQQTATTANVHRLRRATRHMRMLLDVLQEWHKDAHLRRLQERIRHLQQVVGPLRDRQVRLGTVRSLVERAPELKPLLNRAEKEERAERRIVDELLQRTALKNGAPVRRRLKRKGKRPPREALMRTIERFRDEVLERWEGMRPHDQRSMHRARVALRRYTHLLSTMQEHLDPALARKVAMIKRMQQTLGRIHDTQVLLDWLGLAVAKIPSESKPAVIAFRERTIKTLGRRVNAFLREHRKPGA
jgi:CHAD domain-containing protein